jgi:hypothetical protein
MPNAPKSTTGSEGLKPKLNQGQASLDWKVTVDSQVSGIYSERPQGLDRILSDVFHAVAVAVRECTRLIASIPHLWQRPDDYCLMAKTISDAVSHARTSYLGADVRLRRAGGTNAVLKSLNDTLAIRSFAPTELKNTSELNPILTRLYTNREKWFQAVEGRGVIDQMLEQLAHCPPEKPHLPSSAGGIAGLRAEIERLIERFLHANETTMRTPLRLVSISSGT